VDGGNAIRPLRRELLEYACHEGNYSLANALASARAIEKATAAKQP
jgi:hypothetical protein